MRFAFLALALLSLFGLGAEIVNFDTTSTGELPPYWTPVNTSSSYLGLDGPVEGPPGEWMVRRDASAPTRPNVFSQTSRAGTRFEMKIAVFDKVICRDGDLSAKLRIRSGPGPKSAGLVWRYKDPKNFYMLQLSAQRRNVALLRIQNGKARQIPASGSKPGSFGVNHDIRTGVWYLAKVVFRGSRIRVVLGNRLLFDAVESAPPISGKTGAWTTGSTIASFDDFRVDRKD